MAGLTARCLGLRPAASALFCGSSAVVAPLETGQCLAAAAAAAGGPDGKRRHSTAAARLERPARAEKSTGPARPARPARPTRPTRPTRPMRPTDTPGASRRLQTVSPWLSSVCATPILTGLIAPGQGLSRWLSTTAKRNAHAVEFVPSSSPELDDVLETIRSKILLPSYLRAEQRRQIYSPRYEQKLRADPITLEIDGEVHRFTHMDLFRDVPNARAAARDAVGRMATREDFDNLPRLLEGLHRAGRRLRPADYARIARRAGERGCIYAVIESARTVRRTGFRLDSSETVAEILTHVQLKAVDSGWAEPATRQALTWAELVVELLEDENHARRPPPSAKPSAAGGASTSAAAAATEPPTLLAATPTATALPPPPPPAFPLVRDPQVLAARLNLAAAVAGKFGGGADPATATAAAKVQRYAEDLVRLWPAGKNLRQLHPAATYTDRRGEMHYLNEDNKFLGVAAPLLYGLDAAMDVLRSSSSSSSSNTDSSSAVRIADQLQERRDALGAEVAAALAKAPDRRGAAIYKKFFGGEGVGGEEEGGEEEGGANVAASESGDASKA